MRLGTLIISSFLISNALASSYQSRIMTTFFFCTSALVTILHRDYGARLREFIGTPRAPQLTAPPSHSGLSSNESLNMGDVLIDKSGNIFFYMTHFAGSSDKCILLCVSKSLVHENCPVSDFTLAKKVDAKKQRAFTDEHNNLNFKLVQSYSEHVLLYSFEHNIAFVAPKTNTVEFIRENFMIKIQKLSERELSKKEYLKLLESELDEESVSLASRSTSPGQQTLMLMDETFTSPDSVAWQDSIYAMENMSSLFEEQEESDEISTHRLRFIEKTLIPHFKSKRRLDYMAATVLITSARKVFSRSNRIHDIKVLESEKITVVGDIHGQFKDLLTILKNNNFPSKSNKYLFNGDIVDRGDYSVACLFLLLAFKISLPDSFFINRGNHEAPHCGMEKFYSEMHHFYDKSDGLFWLAHDMFQFMPTAHIINRTAFVVHGGIPEILDIEAYNSIERTQVGSYYLINDEEYAMLWYDPCESAGITPNPDRGASGYAFGPDITANFLDKYGFQILVRSHSYIHEGFRSHHENRCWTVFSAPNYCGCCSNTAAVIVFESTNDCLTSKVSYFK